MDLNKLDASKNMETGVDMILKHPETLEDLENDKGKKMTLTVVGTESTSRKKALRQQARELAAKRRGKRKPENVTDEELDKAEASALELIVCCISGWKNILIDGEDVKYSAEAARELLTRFPWIRDQVEEFVNDLGNFLPDSKKA